LWILRNSFIEKALDDHKKIKLFYKIIGLDELERRSGRKSDRILHRKMCINARVSVHSIWDGDHDTRSKVFSRTAYALEWKSMPRSDRLEVQTNLLPLSKLRY
jgi:hypothetical protein